jgi:peroxiredoxin
MDKLMVGDRAPDFSLAGADGKMVTLSEMYAKQSVILVFNIGFA